MQTRKKKSMHNELSYLVHERVKDGRIIGRSFSLLLLLLLQLLWRRPFALVVACCGSCIADHKFRRLFHYYRCSSG